MLTPRFEISQTDSEVLITIHAPYTNIKDCEVYVEGTDFRFFSTPYYLRLQLPGKIIENEESDGSYDCEKGDYYLRFSKENKGEHFPDLDLITSLLAPPKRNKNFVPTIEVIENPNCESTQDNEDNSDDQYLIDQQVCSNLASEDILNSPKYGFANKISGAFAAFDEAWLKEVIDLSSPDTTLSETRRILRENQEKINFNEEHYLADLMKKDLDPNLLTYSAEWHFWTEFDVKLNDEEKDILKELPNKEYLLNNNEFQSALLGIIDILYGSCYDERLTLGESTVESSWTINKLSSTLSWFETFTNINDVVKACIRRSLCYPLVRNWDISVKVLEDVKKAIKLGKKYIIKRFCDIHSKFNNSLEPRYILNQLYIKDYLIWIQKIPQSSIETLYDLIVNITPEKKDVDLDLEILEQAAYSVYEEYLVIKNSIDDLGGCMNNLSLNPDFKSKTETDNSDDESDTSSSSSSSSSDSSSSSNDSSLDSDDDPDISKYKIL